jgi:prevent-host-death family protein
VAKRKTPSAQKDPRVAESIPAAEFKAKCLEFVNQVSEQHVEYVVTRHGHPMAKLVPIGHAQASAIGFLRGTVVDSGDIVSPDFDAWEASALDPLVKRR